ncbi:O-antigen ligase family protein [Vibrio casei]|uniref:O-antigen ligase family protein n=1 Tax=Vibrio casei TaxID=673372 RepID=UPI003F97989D
MKKSAILSYPYFLLVFILCGSVFLSFTPYIPTADMTSIFDNKRFFIILYILITAGALMVSSSLRSDIIQTGLQLPKRIQWILLTAIFFAFIANMSALYWYKSQAVFSYWLMLIIMTFILRTVVLEHQAFISRFYVWLTIMLFLSVFLFHFIANIYNVTPNLRYLFSFVNPRYINHVQIWLILPLFHVAWLRRNNQKSWFYCLPVILNFCLLFALDARGAFIASLSGIVLFAILTPTHRVEILKKLALFLAIGLAIKWLLFTPLPQYFLHGVWAEGQGEIRLSDSNRLHLWENAIQMISFWGYGGDTFVCNNDEVAHTTHNSILAIAIEWGVITALCYLTLLLMAFYRVCTTSSHNERVLGITMLSGFAYSFISSVLNTPISQGLAMISVALFWATIQQPKEESLGSINMKLTTSLSKVLHGLLMVVAISAITFIGHKTYMRIDHNQYRDQPLDYYMPQFWLEHNCKDAQPKLVIK